MRRQRALSPHSQRVLIILLDSGGRWSHGYDLARAADIKSGTLYPLLIRLAEQGLLEAEWQAATGPGRPPRHAYRLTLAGAQLARNLQGEAITTRSLAIGKAAS
jgi:DNA-binding PadR family transcriptional regulator